MHCPPHTHHGGLRARSEPWRTHSATPSCIQRIQAYRRCCKRGFAREKACNCKYNSGDTTNDYRLSGRRTTRTWSVGRKFEHRMDDRAAKRYPLRQGDANHTSEVLLTSIEGFRPHRFRAGPANETAVWARKVSIALMEVTCDNFLLHGDVCHGFYYISLHRRSAETVVDVMDNLQKQGSECGTRRKTCLLPCVRQRSIHTKRGADGKIALRLIPDESNQQHSNVQPAT